MGIIILLFILGTLLIISFALRLSNKSKVVNHEINNCTRYRIVSPDGEYRYLEYLTDKGHWKPVPKISYSGKSADETFDFNLYTYSDGGSNSSRHNYYFNNNASGHDITLERFVKDYPNIKSYWEVYKNEMAHNKKITDEDNRKERLKKQQNKQTRIL